MIYYMNISEEVELEETWVDPNVPNMRFVFREITLDQCRDNNDGTYEASYETFDVAEVSVFHYYDETNTLQEYILNPGEYGVRPKSRRA